MKLYFAPGACSLSPHIVLHEAGLAHEIVRVDMKAKTTADGGDFLKINPKGQVPALQLDDGDVLTEGPAIVQYLADQAPQAKLAPPAGTMARYRLQEQLNFVTSELHKTFAPLFSPATPAEFKTMSLDKLRKQFGFVDARLAAQPFLAGETFSVADAYLFTVSNWAKAVSFDLAFAPHLLDYRKRVQERPAVQEAMRHEGLIT
jgi:glutathione S-transferase